LLELRHWEKTEKEERKIMIRKAIVSGVLAASLVIGGGVVAYTQQGCTKAQGVILESGIPTDVQTIWCVINTATSSGGSLEAVAQQCGAGIATVAEILWEAGQAKTVDAGTVPSTPAIVSTLAYAQAKTKLGK
jgi:hypothetical protein